MSVASKEKKSDSLGLLELKALITNRNDRRGKNTARRKLELPSFEDQLALASSSVVPRAAKTLSTDLMASKRIEGLRKQQPKKSSLKKTSSYGLMEEIGKNIPIRTHKNNWKTLPVPKVGTCISQDKKKPVLQEGSETSPPLLEHESNSIRSPSNTIKHNVSFSKVTIRDYTLTAGDGSCPIGPPVALDWNYQERQPLELIEYEDHRLLFSKKHKSELHMHPWKRIHLLKRSGADWLTEADIHAAAKEAQKTHRQRARTNRLLPLMKLEDMMESAGRKAKRLLAAKAARRSSSRSPSRSLSTGCWSEPTLTNSTTAETSSVELATSFDSALAGASVVVDGRK